MTIRNEVVVAQMEFYEASLALLLIANCLLELPCGTSHEVLIDLVIRKVSY